MKLAHKSFKVFQKPPIEESYDYAEQVRRQIERCLEASAIQDDDIRKGTYTACVKALFTLVPLDDRNKEFMDALEAFPVTKEVWVYKTRGGRRFGTIENPIHGSPELQKRIDWAEFFTVLFNKFVELKVTVRRGSYVG